jgi:hypothetical protein
MNLIPIGELVEIWARVHQEAVAKYAAIEQAADSDLSWWREACQYLRPTPEDNEILNEESGEQTD